VRDREN
jgi:uncharacterized protein (DUF3084 family)